METDCSHCDNAGLPEGINRKVAHNTPVTSCSYMSKELLVAGYGQVSSY